MNRNTVIAFFLFFLGLVVGQTYQLEFDWKLNTVSSDIQIGYATWNMDKVVTMREKVAKDKVHHEKVSIDFAEGPNILSFFYVGLKGEMMIDNVVITQPPKKINLLINGDFELPKLQQNAVATFSNQIPGWSNPNIKIMNNVLFEQGSGSQALFMNPQFKSIKQKISFGKIEKYSFISSIDSDIQKMATKLINQKLQKVNITKWTSSANYTNKTTNQVEQMIHNQQTLQNINTNHIQEQLKEQLKALQNQQIPDMPDISSYKYPNRGNIESRVDKDNNGKKSQ